MAFPRWDVEREQQRLKRPIHHGRWVFPLGGSMHQRHPEIFPHHWIVRAGAKHWKSFVWTWIKMNESPNPKTIPEQLRELRDAQQVEVDRLTEQLERAKEELKRLNKALKQWEPKEWRPYSGILLDWPWRTATKPREFRQSNLRIGFTIPTHSIN